MRHQVSLACTTQPLGALRERDTKQLKRASRERKLVSIENTSQLIFCTEIKFIAVHNCCDVELKSRAISQGAPSCSAPITILYAQRTPPPPRHTHTLCCKEKFQFLGIQWTQGCATSLHAASIISNALLCFARSQKGCFHCHLMRTSTFVNLRSQETTASNCSLDLGSNPFDCQ